MTDDVPADDDAAAAAAAPPGAIGVPPPPRAATPRVRRRAWADPSVRLWWVMGLATVALGLYLGVTAVLNWRHDEWLRSQPPVQATITRTDIETVPNRPVKPGQLMELTFDLGGVPRRILLVQRGFKGEPMTGQPITLYANPADPNDATIRNESQAVTTVLAGAIILAALAVPLLAAAAVARARVLRAWRLGEARWAVPLGRQQTALAPGARSVRCAWADDAGDRRVFSVYVPARSPEATAEAEVVRVLAPPGKGGRPVAIAWFE